MCIVTFNKKVFLVTNLSGNDDQKCFFGKKNKIGNICVLRIYEILFLYLIRLLYY